MQILANIFTEFKAKRFRAYRDGSGREIQPVSVRTRRSSGGHVDMWITDHNGKTLWIEISPENWATITDGPSNA